MRKNIALFAMFVLIVALAAACGPTTREVDVPPAGTETAGKTGDAKMPIDDDTGTTTNPSTTGYGPNGEPMFPKPERATEWLMYGRTSDNMNQVDANIKLPLGKKLDAEKPQNSEYRFVSFSAPQQNRIFGNPAVVRDRIFFGCEIGYISSYFFEDSKPDWRGQEQLGPIITPIAADQKRIVFGTSTGKILCYDLLSASQFWFFDTGKNISAPPGVTDENVTKGRVHGGPKIVDGKVYFGAFDGGLYCLNAKDGSKIWTFQTKGKIYSSPAISGGKIYFVNFESKLFCISQNTGKLVWEVSIDKPSIASPVVFGSRIWVGGKNSKMMCFSTEDGKKLWEYKCSDSDYGIESTPALDEKNLYFGDSSGNVQSIDRFTGKLVWKKKISDMPVNSTPLLVRENLFIGAHDKNLYILSKTNGGVLDTFKTKGSILASPIVIGDELLCTSWDSNIYILRSLKP